MSAAVNTNPDALLLPTDGGITTGAEVVFEGRHGAQRGVVVECDHSDAAASWFRVQYRAVGWGGTEVVMEHWLTLNDLALRVEFDALAG